MKNCIGIRLAGGFLWLSSGRSRDRNVIASLVFLCRTFRVRPWKTHMQGMWIPHVAGSFVRRCRRFRMRYRAARLVQLSVHFQSKWHHAPFGAFLSIFHESTSQCNEWHSFKIRCRYINPKTKRCAVSFCIQVTNSQGHLTLGFKNSPVGRFLFLCAPLLCDRLNISQSGSIWVL